MWTLYLKRPYLKVKVSIIHILQKYGLIKNVWHQCELDLAEIEANELYKLFKWNDKDGPI